MAMHKDKGTPKLVAYFRVSTKAQERSGLGLEGQDIAVERYRASVNGAIIRTFTETETGTRKRSRPVLTEALRHCRQTGATLVVAKLDRLARDAKFLLTIIDEGATVFFCDMPHVDTSTPIGRMHLTIMASIAEFEAARISERVREGLAAYKANRHVSKRIRALYPGGVPPEIVEATAGKLGASLPHCRTMMDEARRKGAATTAKLGRAKAIEANRYVAPLILAWKEEGKSLHGIARDLNAAGFLTAGNAKHRNGKSGGAWSATQVRRVIERVANPL
jgi:DNA invertase Pin-like site-specific DNA recombinase